LVTASLTCRKAGLPDRAVNPSTEKVGFVLRRLKPGSDKEEMAWVTEGGKKIWKVISSGTETQMASHEEMFAMFPLTYCEHGQRRRVWAGLIPTSSRETFNASGLIPSGDSVLPSQTALQGERDKLALADPLFIADVRLEELDGRVLKRLRELENPTSLNRSAVESEAGLFLLLDLADWLEQTIPEAWSALQGSTPASSSLYLKLYNLLALKKLASGTPWRQAIFEVKANAAKLYGEGTDNNLPNFDLRGANPIAGDLSTEINALLKNASVPKKGSTSSSGRLPMPVFSKFDALGATEIPKYVLRCVYLRPHCYPWSHELLSTASQAFTIAAFFDADAPVRPVRITLPDTSLANLRKFKKGVSFSISKQLRQQLNAVGSAKDALDGKLSSGQSFDFGMICSLSIPIITICAFMVLMIFLIVLNLVFWWLPFFRICFPIIKPK
jgi:hypothetical protein